MQHRKPLFFRPVFFEKSSFNETSLYRKKFSDPFRVCDNGILYKADPDSNPDLQKNPGHLENKDRMPKFTVLVKSSFLINWRVLISNMTYSFFSNSRPKIPKLGNFDNKFLDFCFCTKLYDLLNSKMLRVFWKFWLLLISNMAIVFF